MAATNCRTDATVSADEVRQAAALIREGKLVAFPTETVYGLGANALSERAVRRIFTLKRRPLTSPLIVHVASSEHARELCAEWPTQAEHLAARLWPGPLTIVLPKSPAISGLITAGRETVALRVPAHPVALALLQAAQVPVAAPSANRFANVSPTTAEHVREEFGSEVDWILNGGPAEVGIESAVVSLVGPSPALLRPGAISRAVLEDCLGQRLATQVDDRSASPGLHPRHYAPKTRLLVVRDPANELPMGRGRLLRLGHEPQAYAASLYAELRRADREGWDWIAVEEPPETVEWEGIRDRLLRASTLPDANR